VLIPKTDTLQDILVYTTMPPSIETCHNAVTIALAKVSDSLTKERKTLRFAIVLFLVWFSPFSPLFRSSIVLKKNPNDNKKQIECAEHLEEMEPAIVAMQEKPLKVKAYAMDDPNAPPFGDDCEADTVKCVHFLRHGQGFHNLMVRL
jgi:hypothetical protein